jgi:predicted metal-dependent hydrolase
MPRPKLTWSRKLTRRKYGHYDFLRDTVMVSRSLDQPEVPAFVVDYIVYHELLHKKLGLKWTNGRKGAHTPEFHREMKTFTHYHQSESILKSLTPK